MAQNFDFDLDLQRDSVSPETATPASQQSPQKSQRRWSASTDGTRLDYDPIASSWEAPPVPPIPPDQPPEAWRRRSMKRDSYTSQMSLRLSESGTRPQTPVDNADQIRPAHGHNEKTNSDTVPGMAPKRRSRLNIRGECQYEELHWQVSGLNPKGWTRRKKWMHTIAAGGVAFTVLFSSSIVAPASATIETSFSAAPIVAILSTPLYVLGLSFGSILGTGSSALVGRKIAQSCSLVLSVAFTIASACVDSFAALHACRFFAGLFASPALWISLAILLEAWSVEKLAMPLTAFSMLALSGLTLGPVAGSFIIESQNVRWTQYTIIIACAVALAMVLAMRETHKDTVQRRRREVARPPLGQVFVAAIVRPIKSACSSPATLLHSLYAGTILGTFYISFTAFPSVFADIYDMSLSEQGLTFTSILIGVLCGSILLLLHNTLIYRPRVRRSKQQYDAEVERALAEEKQLKRRSRRNSRASSKFPKRKSTASLFSSSHPSGSRLSLVQALTKHDSRTDLVATTIDFEDKNVALSVAAAEYLNSVNEKRILPERVLLILSKQPPFSEMCEQLESYGLKVDRIRLAQVFLDALQQQPETRPATAAAADVGQGNASHDASTPAALETRASTPKPGLKPSASTWTLLSNTSPTFKAPPTWRLWPALPASLVGLGALCLFGWTARGSIYWIAPVVGMGLFATSGVVALVSVTLYMLDKNGEDAVAGGSLVAWLIAAVFPIFGVVLFRTLDQAWATSVLGLIGLVCSVPVWVMVLRGGRR